MRPPEELKIGPPPIRKAFNELRKFAIANRPLQGLGVYLQEIPGTGTAISTIQSKGGSGGVSSSWVIAIRNNGTEQNPAWQFSVAYGRLFDGYSDSLISVSGIEDENATDRVNWHNFDLGDHIYIKAEYDEEEPYDRVSLEVVADENIQPMARISGGHQSEMWFHLGKVKDSDGQPKIWQPPLRDLRLLNECFNGVGCEVIFPF